MHWLIKTLLEHFKLSELEFLEVKNFKGYCTNDKVCLINSSLQIL